MSSGQVALPAIVVAAADADRNQQVERELRQRYGTDFEVVRTGTVAEAMDRLQRRHAQGNPWRSSWPIAPCRTSTPRSSSP